MRNVFTKVFIDETSADAANAHDTACNTRILYLFEFVSPPTAYGKVPWDELAEPSSVVLFHLSIRPTAWAQ